jgi:pyridinium-3,5-biscarboxylic acid mononucleotide sulfurtransferase
MSEKVSADLNSARQKAEHLEKILAGFKSPLVAFSGGVDSTFLLYKAVRSAGAGNVTAVTLSSDLNPPGEVESAKKAAAQFEVKHIVHLTDPLSDPEFRSNRADRCYICKMKIYGELLGMAGELGSDSVLDGSNADDISDYRPGLRALQELNVRSPLLEASLTKAEIRLLSKEAGLSSWEKHSAACLASRFPYGEALSAERLKQVYEAEIFLKQTGISGNLRVRRHGLLARIEVEQADFKKLLLSRELIVSRFAELGFDYVTLDLMGFESGSMNRALRPPPGL